MSLESKRHEEEGEKAAREILSEMTGESEEKFDSTGYPIPNFEDQEIEVIESDS